MKLLLDEMISAVVTEQLRDRRRDVEAVGDRRELRGLSDRDLFEYAETAKRSIVTLEPIPLGPSQPLAGSDRTA